ncbi:MAG: hypothetical protein ACI9FJ_002060 [Alteromonadaceae bacterium]|jgi:hypothetical protein
MILFSYLIYSTATFTNVILITQNLSYPLYLTKYSQSGLLAKISQNSHQANK